MQALSKKRSSRALAALLAAALPLCGLGGCGGSALRQHADTAFSYRQAGYVDDAAGLDAAAYAAGQTWQAALSAMRKVLDNGSAALYLGENYDIALLDRATGAVWSSNRARYEEAGAVAGEADLSQVSIRFYDQTDTLATLNSYPAASGGADADQVTVEEQDGVLRVTYAFGTRLEDLLLAPAFSAQTYDALIETAQSFIDAGELTVMQVGRFKMGYIHLVYDDLTEDDRAAYTKQYPKFPELGELYAMKPNLTNRQKREISQMSALFGLTQESIDQEIARLGEVAQRQDQSPYFEIPIEYRLDGRDLLVTLDTAGIVEQKGYHLYRVELLGGLGAVYGADGDLFVPDGSGALIGAGTKDGLLRQVSLPFYGTDMGLDIQNSSDLSPDNVFPVFGLREGGRMLAVTAESGEAMAGITAALPDDTSPYARITPYYTYRVKDSVDLGGTGSTGTQNVYADGVSAYPFVLRYHPLYGGSADWCGLAQWYRQYLTQTGCLPDAPTTEAARLDIDLLGAFTKRELRYGVQTDAEKAATTFAAAQDILRQLAQGGITAVDLNYLGMFDGGLDHRLAGSSSVCGVLGGSDGFAALLDAAGGSGAAVYPAVELTRVYRRGGGLDQNAQLSRYLGRQFAEIAAFRPADGTRAADRVGYLVSPAAMPGVAGKVADSIARFDNAPLYLPSVGSLLAADYHENDEIDREQSKLLVAAALSVLRDAGSRLKLDAGQTYALPYAAALTNVPIDGSDLTVYSDSVPFVGMVLHGRIAYAGPAIDRRGDTREALLRTLESGAGLHYLLMAEEATVFADTAYTDYYSLSAGQWIDEIVQTAADTAAFYRAVQGRTFLRRDTLADGLYACRYEGGVTLYVNYADTDRTAEGRTVAARGFLLAGGEG